MKSRRVSRQLCATCYLYIRKYVEVTPVMREECLAPTAQQRWLMREMNMIDRQISQKTRLLLEMERSERESREHLEGPEGSGGGASDRRHSQEKKNV